MDHGQLADRKGTRRVLVRRLIDPGLRDAVPRRVVDDALADGGIEVRRRGLDHLERIPAARASAFVHERKAGAAAVVRRDNRLCRRDRQMIGQGRHVGGLPGTPAVVSAVGVDRRRAGLEDARHLRIANRAAGEPARCRLKVAIPPGAWASTLRTSRRYRRDAPTVPSTRQKGGRSANWLAGGPPARLPPPCPLGLARTRPLPRSSPMRSWRSAARAR